MKLFSKKPAISPWASGEAQFASSFAYQSLCFVFTCRFDLKRRRKRIKKKERKKVKVEKEMASEHNEALLKKNYYENCPGCKVDRLKESQRGVPIKQLLLIWIIVLCVVLPIYSLFPFLYFLVRDFGIAKRDEDIGFYAGFIGSSFMFGRALTSVFWGIMADRYGRKPVIIIGTTTVVIFNTLFGLSLNYWMAITTRFLLGSMNGLLGPMRAYASEVFNEEYHTLGLSAVSTAWGIGMIIGPALGGYLAQPAEKFPNIFAEESIFGRFPYFLSCLCISIFALAATIACFWLPETLHVHDEVNTTHEDSCDALEAASYEPNANTKTKNIEGRENTSKKSLIGNWPLMSSIIVYCVFSLHDMAYTEIFSIWAESPRELGGLSYSTDDVGNVLSISGFGVLMFQLLLYSKAEKVFGPIMVSRVAGVLSIFILSSYPLIPMLSGNVLTLVLNIVSVLKNALDVSILTGLFILQNNSVDQHQRGAANGISMTLMSLCRACGPAGGGAMFSWAQKRQHAAFLPGDQMVFFLLNVVEAVAVLMTFEPFLVERKKGR